MATVAWTQGTTVLFLPNVRLAGFMTKLKERKLIQWGLAYLAGLWALLQVVDVMSNRFGWPELIFRLLAVIGGIGFFAALIVAWYHGEQGRQRVSGAELLMLAAVLFVAGVAASFVNLAPSTAAREPPATDPVVSTARKTPAKYRNSPGFDAYVRGSVRLGSENAEDIDKAISDLQAAIAADANLAPAYAELARAYRNKAFYFAKGAEKKQLNEDAEVAIERAMALDAELPEVHFARGLIVWTQNYRFPHEQAIKAFQRAIELDPNLDEAHHQLGLVYTHVGLLTEGRAEFEKAVALDRTNTLARFRFGVADLYSGNYQAAYEIFKSTPLEKNPSLWAFQYATVLLALGRSDDARALLEKYLQEYPADEGGVGNSVLAMLHATNGDTAAAQRSIQRAIETGSGFGHFHHAAYNIASAYARMHHIGEAVKWLQAAADDGFPCYPLFQRDPNLDDLRKDPRFLAMMAELRKQWLSYRKLATPG